MNILHIEHPVRDFDNWKKAFESDPANREQSGVKHHQILRPVDDPNYIMIDLYFESTREAEDFLTAMREVWQSPRAGAALSGSPKTRIIEVVENKEY